MPNDSLASIRSELQERLDATHQEASRLRAALDALNGGSSSATSRPAADARHSAIAAAATLAHAGAVTTRRRPQRARSSTTSTGRAKRGAPRKGRGPLRRAPRGANKATVVDAAQRMPGSTAAEIRTATGLPASVISREIRALVKSGVLQVHQLPDWKPTYTAPK